MALTLGSIDHETKPTVQEVEEALGSLAELAEEVCNDMCSAAHCNNSRRHAGTHANAELKFDEAVFVSHLSLTTRTGGAAAATASVRSGPREGAWHSCGFFLGASVVTGSIQTHISALHSSVRPRGLSLHPRCSAFGAWDVDGCVARVYGVRSMKGRDLSHDLLFAVSVGP